jgi:hypothetical protein
VECAIVVFLEEPQNIEKTLTCENLKVWECMMQEKYDSFMANNTWTLSQPHFEAIVKMKLTFPKVGTWSPPGLPKTQSLIVRVIGKVLKCRCYKMASHEPFGHLQHKLWSKERPGVKLTV